MSDYLHRKVETPEDSDPPPSLEARVAAVPYWYHKIELPGGVTTPGWAPMSQDAYKLPDDLTGKRVLDVGAWDGYWTFECLKRGAEEVVAIDDFSDVSVRVDPNKFPPWHTFDLCRDALGLDPTRCPRHEALVYDVTEDRFGRFDLVLLFGVLYHCRYPMLALDRLSAVCDGDIIIESATCDFFSPYESAAAIAAAGDAQVIQGVSGHGKSMVLEFYPNDQLGQNPTNWWAPTTQCLAAMVRAAGWDGGEAWLLTLEPTGLSHCRSFVRGSKTPKETTTETTKETH